jgi:membrane-associated protein
MGLLFKLVDFILHVDKHLEHIITLYGTWTLAILFLIIFMETGFVVTPFLPGDSLLFAAAAFAARGALNPWLLFGLLSVAAVLGDTVNYWIGTALAQHMAAKSSGSNESTWSAPMCFSRSMAAGRSS